MTTTYLVRNLSAADIDKVKGTYKKIVLGTDRAIILTQNPPKLGEVHKELPGDYVSTLAPWAEKTLLDDLHEESIDSPVTDSAKASALAQWEAGRKMVDTAEQAVLDAREAERKTIAGLVRAHGKGPFDSNGKTYHPTIRRPKNGGTGPSQLFVQAARGANKTNGAAADAESSND